jgi:hypothetical protein
MPQRPKSSEQLAKIIRKAFASSQYPGDNRLVYDNSGSHLECNQVADAFKGKHWADLPVDFLRRHADSMFFFTPEAYRFYLPAYLLAAVLSYRDADVIPNNLVHTFIPPASEGPERERFESRTHGFDAQQRLATKMFLEFLSSEHSQDFPRGDPQIALDKYWS